MNVLIDTPIWSALYRRQPAVSAEANELRRLILARRALIIGPTRQELLSGIRHPEQFRRLRDAIRAFPDITLIPRHFERAAECCNTSVSRGVQGSHTDFLLCAVAEIENCTIFTTDADFQQFAKHLPVRLHDQSDGDE